MYRLAILIASALFLILFLPGCVGLDFSPDGRQLVLTTSKGLTIMNSDGTGGVPIPQGEKGWMPNWSPDGKRILFVKHDNRDGDLMSYEVRSRRIRKIGGDYEPLTGWREDGGRFAAIHKRPAGGIEAVQYDVVEGGVAMRVQLPFPSAGPFKLVWLPNTDDVALMGGTGDNFDVYTVEAGEVKKITTTGDVIGLGISGDGKKLLWARRSQNMKYILMTVYAYDLKSRSAVRLPFPDRISVLNPNPSTAPEKIEMVSFSPDGTKVAIIADNVQSAAGSKTPPRKYQGCYVVRLEGGEGWMLYRSPGAAKNNGIVFPAWTRDGQRIGLLELEDKALKLAIFNSDGTGGRRLFQEVEP